MSVPAPHLDERLRKAPIEQQVAREVSVRTGAHIEHADERAPERLSKTDAMRRKILRGNLPNVGARP